VLGVEQGLSALAIQYGGEAECFVCENWPLASSVSCVPLSEPDPSMEDDL